MEKTAGHVNSRVPLPGNPRDGSSPYKRQSISPSLSAASRASYPVAYHPDPGRYPPNIHPPPPPPSVSYGSPQLYRDGGLYQGAERLTVVESSGPGGDHSTQHQYREPNDHSQQPQSGFSSQSAAAVAAAAAAAAGRRRPSLLPPSDYTNAINRDRDRYLDSYPSYYERELSSSGSSAGVMPAHAYPMMVGHHGPHMDPADHHLIIKRPRLTIMGNEQKQDAHRMLGIDTDMKREPAYNPQVEAISPTLPMDDYHQDSSPHRVSRDDLLQQISKVDREIAKVESSIMKLKKKQQELEENAAKPDNNKHDVVESNTQENTRHLSIAQIIYAENRKKSQRAQQMLSKLGPKVDLPLYNQPFDNAGFHENKRKYIMFKKRLIVYFKRRQQERQTREKYLAVSYNRLLQGWQKKVERIENTVKKKCKEQKLREFYEKQFPELKKQREDKERFSRVGTRIRSDAELEEIMDGLQEQELEDKKMRSYAVVPPILLDPRQRKLAFQNENSLIESPMDDYTNRQYFNIWTRQEKEIFKEKYLQHPKNFCLISSYLERKSVAECVQYYYHTKKDENYKQLLRKHSVRKKRFTKPNQSASQPSAPQQSGVMTRQGTSTGQADDGKSILSASTSASTISNISSTSTAASCSNVATTTTSSTSGISQTGNSASASGGECQSTDTAKNEQKEQPLDGCENSEKCDSKNSEPGKENIKDDTGDEQTDDNDGESEVQDRSSGGGPHSCVVCKSVLEHYGLSRPLSKNSCHQYGLKEEEVTADMRVCNFCHCRSVRSRYTHCPIISCRTPKRKVKRLRPLPNKWSELPNEIKDPIIQDLQIPPDATKCCSACFNRIARRLGSNASNADIAKLTDGSENSKWSEEEIELVKQALKEHGPNWFQIANNVATKSEAQCKNFYFNYKNKLGLNAFISEKYLEDMEREHGDKAPPTVTDEEESGESTSSCEDFNVNYQDGSDTASAPSPNSKCFDDDSKKGFKDPSNTPKKQLESNILSSNYIDEAASLQGSKDLSASRGSLKSVTDYDSSATVSADEGPSQLDNEPSASALSKGDPRLSSNGSREDSNSQSSAPSFLDENRVKSLLTAASRPDNQSGNVVFHYEMDNSSKVVPDRVELDSGEQIFKKTVRDLIDQAIDTSFPDGTSSNGPVAAQPSSSSSSIPNIHDILKRSEKPAAMLKSRNKEYPRESLEVVNSQQQQQLHHHQQQPSPLNPQIHQQEMGLRHNSSHLQSPHHARPMHPTMQHPNSQFIQQPPPQNMISPLHLSPQGSSGHPPVQSSRIHHGYSHQNSSGSNSAQPVMIPRESLPTVNLYVPDDIEQVKAEDLSVKKDRIRDVQHEYIRTSTFRSPPIVHKGPVEMRHNVPPRESTQAPPPPQHLTHHNERLLGAPPPAHSNQYSRSNEMSHIGDTYYGMRQLEQRTKSPSTYPPDRQSQHIPPPAQQTRPMSPHVQASFMSMRCSPPLKGQNLKNSNGTIVNAPPPPPPLVSSSKHNTPSPKMSMKQEKSGGSITQGTPVNQAGVIPSLGVPPHPSSGRYEEYPHHMSSKDVGGSITLGTPVQHDAPVNKRLPEQPSSAPQSNISGLINEPGPRGVLMLPEGMKAPPPHGYDPYYHRRVSPPANYPYPNFPQYQRPPFATESQISSRQTIMTDYYISQQMQLRRNSGGDKEKEARMSPRMPRDCSPQNPSVLVDHRMHQMYAYPPQPGLPPGTYIQHPDSRISQQQQQQQQQRHQPSPIGNLHESHESSQMPPSGGPPPSLWARGPNHSPTMATPPPPSLSQQPRGVIRSTVSCSPANMPKVKPGVGVIQSPKSASPRSVEMEGYSKGTSPRHPYTHGHDAFGALVDVAIAQVLPKDVSKQQQIPQSSIHDLRNMMPNVRDEKLNSAHKSNVYFDERRGPPPSSLPPPHSQPIKERHKYEMNQKIDTINMEERVRKIGGMFAEDGPSPFVRPEYGRSESDRVRMMHYKSGPTPQQPSSQHQPSLSQSRDGHTIDVEDSPHHHHHRNSPHHHSPSHRGPPPLSGDQRRPSPPQDLSSDSRRSTSEPYNLYTSRGSTSSTYRPLVEREPSKLLFDVLEKDQPKEMNSSCEKPQTLTAANLIDAIISHQINKATTSPTTFPKRRQAPNANEPTGSKNFRISPDPSSLNAEGRLSPYKTQRLYSGGTKPKEELVVTLDDSPMAPDHDVLTQPPPIHQMCNSNAGMRGTSPGSPFVNSDRPTSRGRTPQPSQSPASGMSSQSPVGLKLTLKEHIDAIITNDYQADSAHSHYNRNVEGRPPSGNGGNSHSLPHPQQSRSYLGVPEIPERSSPNVQPSASPDEQMTVYPNWKLRKALQQSKEHQQKEMQQEQRKSPAESIRSRATPTSVSPIPPRSKGLLAPDERQIIRIVQSASPRPSDMSTKSASVSPHMVHPQQQHPSSNALANYQVEPISPPSNFGPDSEASSTTSVAPGQPSSSWITSPNITSLLTTRRMYQPPDSSDATTPQSGHSRPHQPVLSPFEKYVKHKIVEEMRKTSEESSGEMSLDSRSGQPPGNSPRIDDRNNGWSGEKDAHAMKYRGGNDMHEPVTAGMFPGPASQYVPGAIYHPHLVQHQPESVSTASSSMGPTSSRGSDIPRPPYKRAFDVMEAVGSSERTGPSNTNSSSRSRSISPSSSDIGAREVEDIKRKRYRLGDTSGGHITPESSTEWTHQMLVPESSEGMSHRSGSSNSHGGGAREPQLPSSSDHQINVGSGSLPSSSGTLSGLRTGFTSSSSSPDHPQPSRKETDEEGEAQSSGTGLSASTSRINQAGSSKGSSSFEGKSTIWDNEVTSGKDDKSLSQMADSPLSGDMVIDESAAIDSATSSKLEPVSPPPQEGISTSEQGDYPLVGGGRLSSSNIIDPGQSVTSSHGNDTRSSPVGGAGSNGGSSSTNSGNSSSSGVSVGSTYPNSISSTVTSNPTPYPNSSALVNNLGGVSTTYTYPYSALSVRPLSAVNSSPTSPSSVVNTPSSSNQSQQQPNSTSPSNSPVSASREVPCLLMSSQYEPLSDED